MRTMYGIIFMFMCFIALSACSGMIYGDYSDNSTPAMSEQTYAKLQAGAEYLDSSLTAMNTALDSIAGSLPADKAAKLTDARATMTIAQNAATVFKSSMNSSTESSNKAWDTARSAISTALAIVGPLVIQSMLK